MTNCNSKSCSAIIRGFLNGMRSMFYLHILTYFDVVKYEYLIHTQFYSPENGRQIKICTIVKLHKIMKHMAKTTVYGYHNWHTQVCLTNKTQKLSAVAYLFRNFKFLLWIVSSADGQLNINMHSLTISWNFVLNIFLKVLCRTEFNDLYCFLLMEQASNLQWSIGRHLPHLPLKL